MKNQPLIISMYFHPEPAGSAPPISDLAFWMAENGLQPHVITARPSYPDRVVYKEYRSGAYDKETYRGTSIHRLKSAVSESGGILGRLRTEVSFLFALIRHRLTKRLSSNTVISVCPSIFTVIGARLFCNKGGHHLAIVHDIQSGLGASTGQSSIAMKALAALERFGLNRVDKIITLTPEMKNVLQNNGIKPPIEVLPPQVDVSSYPEIEDPNKKIVIYSGAMGKKQGLPQVLYAAKELQDRGSDIAFIIRGQGGVLPELKELSRQLGLTNLSFQPLANQDTFHEAMAEGSVHLVPQDAAGANFALPSKVFSIMASRRAILATASHGSPLANQIEESGAGRTVEPNNAAEFADALQNLIDSAPLRKTLGENGRAFVTKHADRGAVCSKIWKAASEGRRKQNDFAPQPQSNSNSPIQHDRDPMGASFDIPE